MIGSTTVGEIVDALVVRAILIPTPAAVSDRTLSNVLLDVTRNPAAFRIAITVGLLPIVYLVHRAIARR